MTLRSLGALLWLLALLSLLLVARPSAAGEAAVSSGPLFVENVGQFEGAARFAVIGGQQGLWLAPDAMWVTVPATTGEERGERGEESESSRAVVNLRLGFVGAHRRVRVEPLDARPSAVSFYRGGDAARWRERVPVWGGVRYVDLYPGVDLELRAEGGQLVQRWVAREGAARAAVRLRVEGATLLGVERGRAQLATPGGLLELPLPAGPFAWEVEGAGEGGEAARFRVAAQGSASSGAARAGGGELAYGTFLGSSLWDEATAVGSDAAGNLYVAGYTLALEFPTRPGATALPHVVEAFVARLHPGGAGLDWLVLIIGDVEDYALDLAVDGAGRAYAVGYTDSTDFPTTPDAFDRTPNGGFDAFALKVDADGTLAYATLLGTDSAESGNGIAVDGAGHAWLTGSTWGESFPTTPDGLDTSHNGLRDAFLAQLAPDGRTLRYSTFLGGSNQEQGEAVALGGAEGVFVTGWTRSDDFPTTAGSVDPSPNGDFEGFALKLALPEGALAYSTFLGGAGEDRGYALAVDSAGQATVGGRTTSPNFPTTAGAWDESYGGGTCDFAPCPDGFVLRLTSDGAALRYSSFLGGNAADAVQGLALDEAGNAWVAGETGSADFPTTPDALDRALTGPLDAFAALVAPDGGALRHATLLGGADADSANAIARRNDGMTLVAGRTLSPDFPTTADSFDPAHNGDFDAFAAMLDALPAPPPTATPTATPPDGATLFLPIVRR